MPTWRDYLPARTCDHKLSANQDFRPQDGDWGIPLRRCRCYADAHRQCLEPSFNRPAHVTLGLPLHLPPIITHSFILPNDKRNLRQRSQERFKDISSRNICSFVQQLWLPTSSTYPELITDLSLAAVRIPLMSSTAYLAILAITYLGIVRIVRYRRRDQVATDYEGTPGRSLASMTVGDAYVIQRDLSELEFPHIFSISIFFALFKVSDFGYLYPRP